MPLRFPSLPSSRVLIAVLLGGLLSGCNSLGYYSQSVAGQWELLHKRESIAGLLQNKQTPAELKARLQRVQAMRDFASRELALPDNGSFRSYADLQRPYVVWNVFAAAPLSLQLETWCFPVAGCVSYRGYFKQAAAETYAEQLRAQGLETYVGGVAAYSTLGWFDDPLLNTVMSRGDARIAGLIFHELAHQVVYVKGDTAFNEAFATAVELEGVQRWLAQQADAEAALAYMHYQQRQEDFVELVTSTRDHLQQVYAGDQDEAEKRLAKQAIIDEMRGRYAQLKSQWQGYAGYDAWFAQDINNAQLAAVTTYRDHVPAFQTLLAQSGGDFSAFYTACEKLADLPQAERHAALARLRSEQLRGERLALK